MKVRPEWRQLSERSRSFVFSDIGFAPVPATSALLVPVLEVEPTIDRFRRRLDPTCRQGMPAHVTIVVPFMPPAMIGDSVIAELSTLFLDFESFPFILRRTNWFEKRVLYLEPDTPARFRLLTEAVVSKFPDYPPYNGEFAEVIPHLTIAEGGRWRKRKWRMRRVALRLKGLLPLSTYASEVWLMEFGEQDQNWRRVHTFMLGGSQL